MKATNAEQLAMCRKEYRRFARKSAPIASGSLGLDYVVRCAELRRQGHIPIVLVQDCQYWLATNPADPWGSKERISHEALRQMIDRAELENL